MSVVQDLLQQIEKGINHAQLNEDFTKKGEILELKDGVATVIGLDTVMFSEIVLFENGLKGLVLDLSADGVGVLVLGDYSSLKQGDSVSSSGQVFSVGVGEEYLGRVLNGIGDRRRKGYHSKAFWACGKSSSWSNYQKVSECSFGNRN